MRLHFQAEQWLPLPVPVVFAFFANPANLPPLMPAWQKARIERAAFQAPPPRPKGSPEGVAAGDGTVLTITARPFPFSPLRGSWLARIEDFRWNEGFCDVQLKGPFRYWRHCHSVQRAPCPTDNALAGTLVRDHLEYELPLPTSGRFVAKYLVLPVLRWLFRYRQRQVVRLLLGAGGQV